MGREVSEKAEGLFTINHQGFANAQIPGTEYCDIPLSWKLHIN